MKRPRGTCPVCGQSTPVKKNGFLCEHYPRGGGLYCEGGFRNTRPLEATMETAEHRDEQGAL